jgi:hypothetical protein
MEKNGHLSQSKPWLIQDHRPKEPISKWCKRKWSKRVLSSRIITPCSLLKVNRCLCLLHASRWFLAWLILRPWRWRWHVPLKHRLTFDGLHGIISHKMELFITTVVRTWNPTKCHSLRYYLSICLQAMKATKSSVTIACLSSEISDWDISSTEQVYYSPNNNLQWSHVVWD